MILIWIFLTAVSLFFYFHGYQKPQAHPSLMLAFHHPLDALEYFLGTLGNTLRILHNLKTIIIVGGVLLLSFFVLVRYILKYLDDHNLLRNSMVWIMLGLYSILTAAMLMIGRLGFGVLQSLASRYTSFTLYLAVAVVFLCAIIFTPSTY